MAVYPTHTLTLLALLGTTSATALAGQVCPEGEVSSILVNAHSFFDTDPSTDGGALPWFYNLANGLHADTNEDFLRGELLFGGRRVLRPISRRRIRATHPTTGLHRPGGGSE